MYRGCPRSSQGLQPRAIIIFFRSYCQGNKRSDHFETLGLHQDASIKEIKAAFLKLSKTLHPDVNPSKHASEEFLKIKTAYDSLVQNSTTSKSTASKTNYSEYYHDTSPEWKRRQGKTRNFDDWLRNLERQNRQRQKTTRSEDKYYEQKDKDDFDEERWHREYNEKAAHNYPGHKSAEYQRYEKSFISYWDRIFLSNKDERSRLPSHSDYILRQLFKTASVLVVILLIGSGIEIYHEMKLDPEQPLQADQPRPEYIEAVTKKSGTLDDL